MGNPLEAITKRLRPGSGGPVEPYSRTMLDDYDPSLHRRSGALPPGANTDNYARSVPIARGRGTSPKRAIPSREDGQFDRHDPDDPRVLSKLFGIRA